MMKANFGFNCQLVLSFWVNDSLSHSDLLIGNDKECWASPADRVGLFSGMNSQEWPGRHPPSPSPE